MASTYPGAVDALVRPDGTDPLSDGHAALHNATSDAVEAVQTELGTTPSGSAATVAARFTAAESATADAQADATTALADAATADGKAVTAQATADAAVSKATYDAHSVLAATIDDTPAAVTVAEQTLLGRKTGGNIAALTVAEGKTLLGLGTAAVVDVPASGDATSGQAVKGSDSRLSDARTPTAHKASHESGGSDAVVLAPAQITGTAVVTADARLSDARTPTAHKTSHQSGGSDEVTLAQSQVTDLTSDLGLKAPLASPTLTGVPTAPTAAVDTNTTQVATTAFTVAQIADDAVAKTAVGNLLTANQATGTDTLGNTTGFVDQGGSPTFVSSTDEAVSGTKSLKVTWNGASTNYIEISGTAANNWFAVTPGSTITVKAMNKAGADTWAYRAFWYQANQTQSATSSTVQSVATQSASWHAADATFVAPADAAFMWVMLYRNDGVDGDITYFDNLSVHFGAGGQWSLPGTPITDLGFYTDESVGRRLFQWDANNARWQMTYGDTGLRDTAVTVANAWAIYGGYNHIRRVGNVVSLNLWLDSASASADTVGTIPAGFRPDRSTGQGIQAPGYLTRLLQVGSGGNLDVDRAGTTPGATWFVQSTWTTSDAWPTSLPGTAVGSIPA